MNKTRLLRYIAAFSCLSLLFTSGCTRNSVSQSDTLPVAMTTASIVDQSDDTASSKIVIGATLADESSSYLISVSKYMYEAAKESDVNLILEYASWDAELQVKQINQFIADKVDAIILCPVNAKLLLNPLKKAKEAGIPVINLNMKVDAISSEYIDTYVGASSSEEAALAAELFVEILGAVDPAGGKIAIIEGSPGSDPQIYRTQTFIEQLAPHPEIEIVAVRNGGWDREKAKLVTADLIKKNPDLRGIYCQDSNMAIGAIEKIEELGLEDQIYVVGIGEDEEYLQAISDGRLYGLITQPPKYEGDYSIYCAVWAAKGDDLRPWYKDPIQVVTQDNIAEYEKSLK
ncbi:MAG: sugar ABC transporter substrate-binding protein [Eubacteriales bacterium]